MGDHTEAISIDFDPEVISYRELLGHFWSAHRCSSINSSRQYRNALFYRDEEQKRIAEETRAEQAAKLGMAVSGVTTAIEPVGTFTYAEGYHQKYSLTRHREVRDFLNDIYPDAKSFADSTVATRLNGYLGTGGRKNLKALEKELPSYGLSAELQASLQKLIDRYAS